MSNKLNKLVTNVPVTLTEQEVINLSETLSAVRTAGGGGEGGHTYLGDGTYIGVDNNNNKISFLSDAANKLESVTDKLDKSDFETASADFATKTELESYATKTELSDYATKAELEDYQIKGDYLSGNALDNVSGTWNTVTQKLDTTAFSTVSGNFLTEVPDTYYTKSQTSGADQLAAAFDAILDYDVTAAAGIKITTATDNGTTTFGISMTAEPVVTDTNLSGYNGIAAAPDGTKSGWWNVGLTQDMLNVINGKEDILSFSYDGDTITAINTSAVGKEFDGVVTAGSLSGNGTINSPLGIKTDAALNLTNASAKSAVSAVYANIAKGAHTDYTLGSTLDTMSNITATIDTSLMSMTGYNGIERQIDETTYYATAFGLTNSAYAAIQYVTANRGDWDNISAKLDTTAAAQTYQIKGDYYSASNPNNYVNESYITSLLAGYAEWEDFENLSADVQNKLYASAAAQTYLDKTIYATDSATYVTSGNEISAANEQYALTTTGWAKIETPATFTGVTTTGSVSGGGVNNDTIGLLTSAENALTAVANKVDKPDTMQESLSNKYLVYSTLTGTGEVTGWTDFNANVYSKTESDGRYQKKTDMSSYLTTAQYETDSATFVTSSNSTITGTKQYALTTAGWMEVSAPTIPDITANNGLSANGHTIGIDNTNLVANTQYAWTTTGWEEVQGGGGSDPNAISAIQLEGESTTVTVTNKKATIPLATASATGVAGNAGVISSDDKEHLDNAIEYKENPYDETSPKVLVPQQMFVCESDQQIIDIVTNQSQLINGKGTIFFRITGI